MDKAIIEPPNANGLSTDPPSKGFRPPAHLDDDDDAFDEYDLLAEQAGLADDDDEDGGLDADADEAAREAHMMDLS